MHTENRISTTQNALVIFAPAPEANETLAELRASFCGVVLDNPAEVPPLGNYEQAYVCGDLSKLGPDHPAVHVIEELAIHGEHLDPNKTNPVTLGQVPILVHGVGVYFRNLFGTEDYFAQVQAQHEFQELTESTKQSKAFRKGIYLSKITKEATENEVEMLRFQLLRCSSNLTGPTDNFRSADHAIMSSLNTAAKGVFEQPTELNHVLAQVYENRKNVGAKGKEVKAKIKAHSDKTKDMPAEGLIAFCTFYGQTQFSQLEPSATDPYDWCYKNTSGLTKLHFKRKKGVEVPALVPEFSVTLYPNSAFIIPLSTNRLYTHEIRPSRLEQRAT
ncbi:MAG: hypothetical protein AAFQ98_14165 [Bacteroidota bacterium]